LVNAVSSIALASLAARLGAGRASALPAGALCISTCSPLSDKTIT
jgi:Na+/H+ antiporter NhaC